MMKFPYEMKISALEIIENGRVARRRGIGAVTLANRLGYSDLDYTSKRTYGSDIVAQIREDIAEDAVITVNQTYIVPILPADFDLVKEWAHNRVQYNETHTRRTARQLYVVGNKLEVEDFEDASELLYSGVKLIKSGLRKLDRW